MKIWRFLSQYIRSSKWWFVLALALNAFHGAALTAQNFTSKYLIDDILLNKAFSTTQKYQWVFVLCGAYLLISIVGRMLFWHLGYRIFTRLREEALMGLRAKLFRRINTLCLRFRLRNNSGELFSYLFGSPIGQIQNFVHLATNMGPGMVFAIISTLIWAGSWDIIMTTVFAGAVVCSFWIMTSARKNMISIHTDFQQTESQVSGQVADFIRGGRDIKLYAIEEKVIHNFEKQAHRIRIKSYQRDIRSHIENMKQETAGYVFFALLVIVGAWRMSTGHIHPGMLVVYTTSYGTLQGALSQLYQIVAAYGSAEASVGRITAVLETSSSTPDPAQERNLPENGEIRFSNVSFNYATEPTIQEVSFSIPYGQKVAFVGPSGSGKSTTAQLIMRLYDPHKGEVSIGGVNVINCSGSKLRKLFGVVPQEPYFFRTTLRENIRFVKPDATDEEVIEACTRANAWEFIEKLPDGLSTQIGEGGASLSGGQKQRIAIARAILLDPPYFIFDEATSALDNVSEKLIQSALENILKDKTAIFIAHRLATVKSCDRVIVLEKGRIVQDGTFDSLAEQPGLFQSMIRADALASAS